MYFRLWNRLKAVILQSSLWQQYLILLCAEHYITGGVRCGYGTNFFAWRVHASMHFRNTCASFLMLCINNRLQLAIRWTEHIETGPCSDSLDGRVCLIGCPGPWCLCWEPHHRATYHTLVLFPDGNALKTATDPTASMTSSCTGD